MDENDLQDGGHDGEIVQARVYTNVLEALHTPLLDGSILRRVKHLASVRRSGCGGGIRAGRLHTCRGGG